MISNYYNESTCKGIVIFKQKYALSLVKNFLQNITLILLKLNQNLDADLRALAPQIMVKVIDTTTLE